MSENYVQEIPEPTNTMQIILRFDRLSVCFNENNLDYVKKTCGLLLDDHYKKTIPGMTVTKNPRYAVSCRIPFPFDGSSPTSVVTFEAGPCRPGISSYRVDFNPSKLTAASLVEFLTVLDSSIDADTKEFFSFGKVTRCDFALDFPNRHLSDVIVRTAKLQKHGVYSDRHGDPQTVYLGTPRSRRVVAYEKSTTATSESCLRLECRLKPGILGYQLFELKNPFASVELISADFSADTNLAIPAQFIADSIRIGGLKRAVLPLQPHEKKALKKAYATAHTLIPNLKGFWSQWPETLADCGLAEELGLNSAMCPNLAA